MPRREERYPNTAVSYDDYLSRDAWEFHWRLLGTDVLSQTVRFPKTRKTIELLGPDRSSSEVPTANLKMMGEKYPHYTPEGGVACYVLEARPRKDWLPDYYCSKLLYWVDRHAFYPLRMEQYDEEGKLFLIEERMARQELPELGRAGYAPFIILDWDLSRDILTYDLQDGRQRMDWPEADRKNLFNFSGNPF